MLRGFLTVVSIIATALLFGPITTLVFGTWRWRRKVKRARKITRRRMLGIHPESPYVGEPRVPYAPFLIGGETLVDKPGRYKVGGRHDADHTRT